MNKKATITIHPSYEIGTVSDRVYGSFLEPIDSLVVGNIWSPNHPTADEKGFRKDMLETVKGFNMSAVRLPGGNFMSGWEWKDSIGPQEKRKVHLDMAWKQFEPNLVGHDEYLEWAERCQTEAMYTLNLGTADILSAVHCLEYTNFDGRTYWSDLRKENGHEEPYGVKIWYLGNEMDGPWQIGSWEKDPKGYGVRVHETSKVMKMMDPTIETVVAGTSAPTNFTYPDWDIEVLNQCYQSVDYLSLHYYHNAPEGNIKALMNAGNVTEEFLLAEISACDVVRAKMREEKTLMISFDEYGCLMSPKEDFIYGIAGHAPLSLYGEFSAERAAKPFAHIDPDHVVDPFPKSNGILEALGNIDILLTLVRHCDRVKIGCMTQALFTALHPEKDPAKHAVLYYPYHDMNLYGRGTAIQASVNAPTFDVEGYAMSVVNQKRAYKNVSCINTVAVRSHDGNDVTVFLINRSDEDDLDITIDMKAFENYRLIEHTELFANDVFDLEEKVEPKTNKNTSLNDGVISLTAKKLSWNVIRLGK